MATRAQTAKSQNGNGSQATAVMAIQLSLINVSSLEPQVRRRAHFTDKSIAELASSIQEQGQIQPIVVRSVAAGFYELVAGERRYLACKLNQGLGGTIDAIARDLTDEQVVEIQLQENLQRKEVEPLDEAFAYKWLVEHGSIGEGSGKRPYTAADIASKFGRTEDIVLRRLKLNDLCDRGRTDLGDGKLPLAHAELIARFPEKEQGQILSRHAYSYYGGAVTYKDLRSAVERSIVRDLAKSPFDVTDGKLHLKNLTCGDCTERTGYRPGLFDGDLAKKDNCLNGTCFQNKTLAMLKAVRRSIAEKLPNPSKLPIGKLELQVPLIRGGYSNDTVLGKDGSYIGDSSYDPKFFKAKKVDECSSVVTALYVEGDDVGKEQLICRDSKCKVHRKKSPSSGSGNSSRSTTSMTPQRKEEQLNEDVYEKVRMTVLTAHIRSFNAKRTIWGSPELRKQLLTFLLQEANFIFEEGFPEGIDKQFIPASLMKLVDAYNADPNKLRAEVDKLSAEQESRIFAMLTFGNTGHVEYAKKPDTTPLVLLAESSGLSYAVIDAEARLELAPKEHKATLQAHLDAVKGGAVTSPPKIFDVPEKPKAKGKKK